MSVELCWKKTPTAQRQSSRLHVLPKCCYALPSITIPTDQNLTATQKALVKKFNNYPSLSRVEEYCYNRNTPYAFVYLRQAHFDSGTVRITRPGIYILQENIIFEPNASNDFMPRESQMGPSGQYPAGSGNAYHLGFFAAITIESNNVILDLNRKSIAQSKLHNLQQRFYAHIELGSAPFIPSQGPVAEGFSTAASYTPASDVLIRNGVLGLSSHHGIHGNLQGNSVILQHLIIEGFEVAGVALNGASHSILDKITIKNSSTDVKVLSAYSQARFIRSFLRRLIQDPKYHEEASEIYNRLQSALRLSEEAVMSDTIPSSPLFGNQLAALGYDGNVYGLVLNINGVVIGDFLESRPQDATGNEHIYLQNIDISNIVSRPVEILALSAPSASNTSSAYGGKRQVGPFGDVFDIKFVTETVGQTYSKDPSKTVLTDAQLLIAKAKHEGSDTFGTVNITPEILAWSLNETMLDAVLEKYDYYFVHGGDSMGHIMKGNIGFFISGGVNIHASDVRISDVANMSTAVSAQAGNAWGLLSVASTDIHIHPLTIDNVETKNDKSTAALSGVL